jgi:hypothetical protein
MMLAANESVAYVNVVAPPLRSSGRDETGRTRQQRDYASRLRAIAALRGAGFVVEAKLIDEQGALLSEERAAALREEVEPAIRELANGRAAHARRTVAALEAARKSDAEQVDDLLHVVYQAHARGEPSGDVLDALLDTFEPWLAPDGIVRVDTLFDHLDLDRAPEAAGILLLATTRLTRAHFARREAFIARLDRWLVGRSGRTQRDVDNLLRGLRE